MNDLYIGFMSGTSCDGVDASLIETDGREFFKPIHNVAVQYTKAIKKDLQDLFSYSKPFLGIEKSITQMHIEAAKQLLLEAGYKSEQIRAIGFHGQTIDHKPESGLTWQMGNPHLLASELNIQVVHDFRRRDLARGGQGAPLIPIFHKLLTKGQKLPCVIVNIGGVANLTYIDKNDLIAFDTGTGNALIDDAMMKYYNRPFDDQGNIAALGRVDQVFIKKALSDKYYDSKYPKSLDRNNFKFLLKDIENKKPQDIVATLTYLTSYTIAHSLSLLPNLPNEIYMCGGGARNNQMLRWLNELIKKRYGLGCVSDISKIPNMDSDYVESQGFAYLAARFCNNLPSAFPSTTGAGVPNICGCLVLP